MNTYRADLHVHTALSPCGDLDMGPVNILQKAKEKGVDILGITDHNSTRNCAVMRELAQDLDIYILQGAEVTTREEAHCLTFFDTDDELTQFQHYLDQYLPDVKNNEKIFGYQVVVDKDENIVEQIDKLLITALDQSIEQIEQKVHELNGIFIPAHINKSAFSVISQLGMVPFDLQVDALELSKHTSKEEFLSKNGYLNDYTFIQSSDAHFVEEIGSKTTIFKMKNRSFAELKKALRSEDGREVVVR